MALSGRNNVVPDRVVDQINNGVDPEFAHDGGSVSLHCLDTYSQQCRHFLVALRLGQELDDFPLSCCEYAGDATLLGGQTIQLEESPEYFLCYIRSEKRLVANHAFNRNK